jgi:hypothetical protein
MFFASNIRRQDRYQATSGCSARKNLAIGPEQNRLCRIGDSANAGETAAGGKQRSLRAPTSKIAGTDVKKPDGKGKAEAANAGEDGRAAAKSRRQAAPMRRSDRS